MRCRWYAGNNLRGVCTALEKAKAAEQPFLIEAIIQQGDMVEPMVAPGAVLDDFVKVAK